jgi:hypothetical protein
LALTQAEAGLPFPIDYLDGAVHDFMVICPPGGQLTFNGYSRSDYGHIGILKDYFSPTLYFVQSIGESKRYYVGLKDGTIAPVSPLTWYRKLSMHDYADGLMTDGPDYAKSAGCSVVFFDVEDASL